MQSTGFTTSDSFLSDSPLNISDLLSESVGELPSFSSDFGTRPASRRSPFPQALEQIRSPQYPESGGIAELPRYDYSLEKQSTPKKVSPHAFELDELNLSGYLEEEGIGELPSFDSSFGGQSTSSKIFADAEGLKKLNLSQYLDDIEELQPFDRISPHVPAFDQLSYPQYQSDEGMEKPPSIDSSFGRRPTPTRFSPRAETSNQLDVPQLRGDELIDLISSLSGSDLEQERSLGLLSGFGPFPKRYTDVQTSTISYNPVIKSFSDLENCCDAYDYLPSNSLKEFCLQNRGKLEGYDSMKEQLTSFLIKYQPQMASTNAPEPHILSEAVRFILEDLMKTKTAMSNLQTEKSVQMLQIEALTNEIQNMQLMPRTSPIQDKGLVRMDEAVKPRLSSGLQKASPVQKTPMKMQMPRKMQMPLKMQTPQKMQALPKMQAQPKMQLTPKVQPPPVSRQLPGPSKGMVKPQQIPFNARGTPRGPSLGYPGGQGSTQKTVTFSSPSGKPPIVVDVNVTARPINQTAAGPQRGLKPLGLPRGKSGLAPPGGKYTRGPTATRMPQGLPKKL